MTPRYKPVWYQARPSADKLGNAYHRHGPLLGMNPPRRSFWWFIGGRKGRG